MNNLEKSLHKYLNSLDNHDIKLKRTSTILFPPILMIFPALYCCLLVHCTQSPTSGL